MLSAFRIISYLRFSSIWLGLQRNLDGFQPSWLRCFLFARFVV
nr:MAG TPA: hypothetical protein [Caudoviricetes sp.]